MASSAGRVLILPKGEWSSATNYEVLDAVYDAGSSYICKKAVLANAVHPENDGAHWQLLAQGNSSGGEGGSGHNTLKRATHYALGDAVFASSAPSWVILVCTTAGTTALSEPAGYASITAVGGSITDGTAVFQVRDIRADNSVAVVSANGTAPSALPIGDHVVVRGILYRVIASVAVGDTLTPGTNITAVTVMDQLKLAHTQFLHTLPAADWTLVSGGDWDGFYKNVLTLTAIYNPSGDVDARGATLATRPSDDVKSAVAGMYFLVDDVAMTLTAYAETAPTVDCYVSVEGIA